jgi:hypothetical protein
VFCADGANGDEDHIPTYEQVCDELPPDQPHEEVQPAVRARGRPRGSRGKGKGTGKGRSGPGKGRPRGSAGGKGKGRGRPPTSSRSNNLSDDDAERYDCPQDHEEEADLDDMEEGFAVYPGLGDAVIEEEDDHAVTFHAIEWGELDDPDAGDKAAANKIPFSAPGAVGTTTVEKGAVQCMLDVLFLLFPFTALMSIVSETNAYESDCTRHDWFPQARVWVPLTIGEFLVWLGLCMGMGLSQYSGAMALYWSGKKIGCVQYPNFSEYMSFKRFEQIKRFFHLRSNTNRPPMSTREGRLWQFLWLEELLNECAKKLWNLSRGVTVDERCIPSRHKMNPCRVYNPSKPHKFAMWQQALVDAFGFIWHTWWYDRIKRVGLKLWVIKMMLGSLKYEGYDTYWDRWYGSPAASQLATRMRQNLTATMPSTYIPAVLKQFTKANMTQGDHHWVYSSQIRCCVIVWKDRARVVYGTNHQRPTGGNVLRLQPDTHQREPVASPEAGVEYNKARPYVDATDAKALGTGSLEVAMTGHKWWQAAFFGLWDVTTCRLESIATALGMCRTRLDCLQQLQKELVSNQMDNPVAGATRSNPEGMSEAGRTNPRFVGKHPLVKRVKTKQGKEQGANGYCKVCQADNYGKVVLERRHIGQGKVLVKKRASRTFYWCPWCKVHLCIGSCHERYHAGEIDHLDYGLLRNKKPRSN